MRQKILKLGGLALGGVVLMWLFSALGDNLARADGGSKRSAVPDFLSVVTVDNYYDRSAAGDLYEVFLHTPNTLRLRFKPGKVEPPRNAGVLAGALGNVDRHAKIREIVGVATVKGGEVDEWILVVDEPYR